MGGTSIERGRSGHLGKENEVLEAGVQVSFGLELTNLVKVRSVDVGIHTEEALEYLLHYVLEIVRKGGTNSTGERVAIIHLRATNPQPLSYFLVRNTPHVATARQ